MALVKNFLDGITNRPVTWNIRHHSAAYDWGQKIAGVTVFIVVPFCIVFGAGFAAGRYF